MTVDDNGNVYTVRKASTKWKRYIKY
jgi:hypothetical protein